MCNLGPNGFHGNPEVRIPRHLNDVGVLRSFYGCFPRVYFASFRRSILDVLAHPDVLYAVVHCSVMLSLKEAHSTVD